MKALKYLGLSTFRFVMLCTVVSIESIDGAYDVTPIPKAVGLKNIGF